MFKKVGWIVVVGMFNSLSFTASAVESDVMSDAQQSCRQWAKEDGISADQMTEYMLSCVAQIEEAHAMPIDLEMIDTEVSETGQSFDEYGFDAPQEMEISEIGDLEPKRRQE